MKMAAESGTSWVLQRRRRDGFKAISRHPGARTFQKAADSRELRFRIGTSLVNFFDSQGAIGPLWCRQPLGT
jgi:hypothetical protein